MPKRILLIGGPSTGKTTLLNHLNSLGYTCLKEISREVIKKAQKEGVEQLFLKNPLLFSSLLKDARIEQFIEGGSRDTPYVFYDRGIPDTLAYMNYIRQEYPKEFVTACTTYIYDQVFILPSWKAIHTIDNERYESFEEAQEIQSKLLATYKKYKYKPINVPLGTPEERAQFIISKLDA